MNSGQHQRGFILIGLTVVLVVAAGLTLLQRANRINASALERDAKTTAALLAARDALLARAVLDDNRPGSLRCPAIDNNGNSPFASPCPSYSGWFPWRTVDLPDLRDASGTELWYVLAPSFRDGSIGGTPALNSSSLAPLSLDGQADIVALIIAPGGALSGQNRQSNNLADYLDDLNGNPATSNRDGDHHYFSGPPSPSFNDRIIALTKATLLDALAMRVLGEIRYAVSAAAPPGSPLPEADTDSDGLPDSGAVSGHFPYKDSAYASINSTTWPGKPWYQSLEDNDWFLSIKYNRTARSVSLNGHEVTLP